MESMLRKNENTPQRMIGFVWRRWNLQEDRKTGDGRRVAYRVRSLWRHRIGRSTESTNPFRPRNPLKYCERNEATREVLARSL